MYVFTNTGYKPRDINKDLDKASKKHHNNNRESTVGMDTPGTQTHNMRAYLPYIQGITDKIAIILKKKRIPTSFKPVQTIRQKMRPVKDPIDPKQLSGIYEVSCSCKFCYIGETGRSFHTRLKEHGNDIRNERIRT